MWEEIFQALILLEWRKSELILFKIPHLERINLDILQN